MSNTAPLEQRFYEMLMESQYWPPAQLLAYQRSQLSQLLRHARSNVAFYKNRLDPVFKKDGEINWDRWQDIPILKRQDLIDHHDSMMAAELPPGHGEVRDYASSGSTGIPVNIRHNGLAFLVSRAALFRANTWHKIDWSKTSCESTKANPKVAPWPDGQLGNHWGPAWDKNATGRVWHINRQASPEQLIQFMQAKQVAYFGARPKTAHALALEAVRLKSTIRLDAVFGHGTGITEEEVEDCRRGLGARLISLYSSTECHKIAHPCPVTGKYHVNAEIALLEIVDDKGQPCPIGEPGRVIITPILNTAQPLIRYDQGDTAIAGEMCRCNRSLPVIDRILGRTTHLFRLPDGRNFSLSIPPSLKEQLGTDDWQLAQVGPLGFEVRYIQKMPSHPEARELIIQNMRKQMGEKIEVSFITLAALPLTPSGKFIENICELP